jgi:hypothetical protein
MDHERGHERVPIAALPLVLVLGLAVGLLVACGSPTPTVQVISTTGPTTGPITALPATPAAVTPAPTLESAPAPTLPVGVAPPCTASDLKASHGLIEGAAGSRLTEVVLVAGTTCSLDAFPVLGIRDATGAAIVGGVAGGTGRFDVSPEGSYASTVRISNWCVAEPQFPLTLEIRLGAEELAVTGSAFDETNVPPCNGEGGPILEATAWVEQP